MADLDLDAIEAAARAAPEAILALVAELREARARPMIDASLVTDEAVRALGEAEAERDRLRAELTAEREAHAATRAERDALQRHYDAASPDHNLLALLDLYHARAEAAEAERDARPAITAAMARAYLNDPIPADLDIGEWSERVTATGRELRRLAGAKEVTRG